MLPASENATDERKRKQWSSWLGEANRVDEGDSIDHTLQKLAKRMTGSNAKNFALVTIGPASLLTLSKIGAYLSSNAVPIMSTVFAVLPPSTSPLGHVAQLGSSILMMLSIKGLGSHETSKKGNFLGMTGVGTAVLTVIFSNWITTAGVSSQLYWFLPVACIGQYIGISVARAVEMENLPELVAGFHSLTGLAAVLVGIASQLGVGAHFSSTARLVETFLGVSVGAATFSGSVAAAAKLHGLIPGGPIGLESRFLVNSVSLISVGVTFGSFLVLDTPHGKLLSLFGNTLASLVLGTMLVLPVGGSDIPIVISFLNAMSGLATSATGFSQDNSLLVMTGALVASSGTILSDIMCKGINRSLISVLTGGFGVDTSVAGGAVLSNSSNAAQEISTVTVVHLVTKLQRAKKVLIIPGYGMAVARCQSGVCEIFNELTARGVDVVFGIHPVAGRLPGHMNVILSEADIPYDFVKEMEQVNHEMETFDIAIVLGANDIVNPATASDPSSPIYGMPAIECWRAKEVIVMKRSMNTGYSGVDNPLFYLSNTCMLFGDAKQTVDLLHSAIRDADISEWPNNQAGATNSSLGKVIHLEDKEAADYPVELSSLPPVLKVIGGLKSLDERRVAISPKVCLKFRKMGFGVVISSNFGIDCGWSDSLFEKHGAKIANSETAVLQQCDIVLKVTPLTEEQLTIGARAPPEEVERKQIVITSFPPDAIDATLKQIIRAASNHPVTTFNLNLVPRISRAQAMDVLSSMANIAGYKATINAFYRIGKLSRPSVTAGGTIPAAKVFVIGCGVAGLSAIATAHALGATVYATDVRAACKEQVQSIGATFIELEAAEKDNNNVEDRGGYAAEVSASFADRQKELYKNYTAIADVVITTAMVPGKKSPQLISAEMVRNMKPGSIVVDMAAVSGGNCELTVPDSILTDSSSKVIIDGTTNFPSELAQLSSELFSQNCLAFLENLCANKTDAATLRIDTDDVIVRQSLVVLDGNSMYPPPPLPQTSSVVASPPKPELVIPVPKPLGDPSSSTSSSSQDILLICGAAALGALGLSGDHRTVRLVGDFTLSSIIGYFTVSSVTPALHTPLISVTNAVSGIIVVGGMLELDPSFSAKSAFALAAVLASLVNVSGGFAVTDRMLAMFKRGGSK